MDRSRFPRSKLRRKSRVCLQQRQKMGSENVNDLMGLGEKHLASLGGIRAGAVHAKVEGVVTVFWREIGIGIQSQIGERRREEAQLAKNQFGQIKHRAAARRS